MKKYKVFIDGQAGTTGLQIEERLSRHEYIDILEIDPQDRKDPAQKKKIIAEADLTFLCLPDDAAKETVKLAKDTNSRMIDASTAHRIDPEWIYGLPELQAGQRELIAKADKVSNPGCYPTGAVLLLKPLIIKQAVKPDLIAHIHGMSGYSGGGKSLIAAYHEAEQPSAYALYGMDFAHKHVPEMQQWAGLNNRPIFLPSVVNIEQGMVVMITLDTTQLQIPAKEILPLLQNYYQNETFVRVQKTQDPTKGRFFHIEGVANTNFCDLSAYHSEEYNQIVLLAKLDNLGKGASGAAVQNMNIMLGLPEIMGVQI